MPGGRESLKVLAENLAERLPCYCGRRDDAQSPSCPEDKFKPGRLEAVLVEGHTDNVPIRNIMFQDNWDLSAKRSIVTYQFLLQVSPELGAMVNTDGEPLFGVSGYAETRPVVPHEGIRAEPLNRRIDLRFILAPPEAERAVPKGG